MILMFESPSFVVISELSTNIYIYIYSKLLYYLLREECICNQFASLRHLIWREKSVQFSLHLLTYASTVNFFFLKLLFEQLRS